MIAFTVLVCAGVSGQALAQYNWASHLSPRPTGFELTRFGTWDLEVVPLRGMVHRAYYESDGFRGSRVRKIVETTRSAPGEDGTRTTFRQSTSHLDRRGRITRIEYSDPLTRKVIQRETFTYDTEGRLLTWRRARPPSEVSVASVTRTLYPSKGPHGMSQSFEYDEAGVLREWRACTIKQEQRLEECEEDYVMFDGSGRIIAFGMMGTHHNISRDVLGNAVRIEVRGVSGEVSSELSVMAEDRTISEAPRGDSLAVANLGWLDEDGRMIQYRVSMPDAPEYYWTATWTYDGKGRPLGVRKGFDTFDYKYDAAGRLVGIKQSRQPDTLYRTYNAKGLLRSQEPPLFYGRLNAGLAGEERYAYDDRGFLTGISVNNSEGQPVAQTELTYVGPASN